MFDCLLEKSKEKGFLISSQSEHGTWCKKNEEHMTKKGNEGKKIWKIHKSIKGDIFAKSLGISAAVKLVHCP